MTYLLFILPGLLLAVWASFLTRSTFEKYAKQAASSRLTGAQAARRLLDDAGVRDVEIEQTRGFLSDHYDPSARRLRLSPEVYGGHSLSSIGVACHEAGHALQHAENYGPLAFRTLMVPTVSLASPISYVFIVLGFLLNQPGLALIGVALFSLAVLFAVATLPVEYNASARAKRLMRHAGIVTEREAAAAGEVLNAAFLTYVAAAVSALLTLIYYLFILGGARRD